MERVQELLDESVKSESLNDDESKQIYLGAKTKYDQVTEGNRADIAYR